MNSINTVLNSITQDIYTDKKTDIYRNFFYTSMLHHVISLEIATKSYEGKLISFEKLCNIIPKKFGCKSSIKTILDHGVINGFFIKEKEAKDKRIKRYKLSEGYSLMLTNWYLDKKVKFMN